MKQSFPSQNEAVQQLQQALTTDLVKTIKYWYRVDSYYAMEKWGVDREDILPVMQTLSHQDVVKYDFHHQDGNATVLVFQAWLLPSLGLDAFAYIKVGLVYNSREEISEIQVLSFKEQDDSLVRQFSDSEFSDQQEAIRASWLQVQPDLLPAIAPEHLSEALVDCALEQEPALILQVGLPWLTKNRIFAAVYAQPILAFEIPKDWLTPALVLHVARSYPAIVECCPELLTPALVKTLVENNLRTMLYISKNYFQPLDYYHAAFSEPELMQCVPQSLLTDSLVDATLHRNPEMLAYVPRQMKTMECCIMAVAYDMTLLRYVPRHLKPKVQQFFAQEASCYA